MYEKTVEVTTVKRYYRGTGSVHQYASQEKITVNQPINKVHQFNMGYDTGTRLHLVTDTKLGITFVSSNEEQLEKFLAWIAEKEKPPVPPSNDYVKKEDLAPLLAKLKEMQSKIEDKEARK